MLTRAAAIEPATADALPPPGVGSAEASRARKSPSVLEAKGGFTARLSHGAMAAGPGKRPPRPVGIQAGRRMDSVSGREVSRGGG